MQIGFNSDILGFDFNMDLEKYNDYFTFLNIVINIDQKDKVNCKFVNKEQFGPNSLHVQRKNF